MPLPSMTIHVEAIKLQNQINALPEIRMDAPDSETRMAERHALMSQLAETRERQIAALEKEGIELEAANVRNVDTDGFSPELRAFRELAQRADMGVYVYAAAAGQEIRDGAEAEYNREVLGNWSMGDYPLDKLLQSHEFSGLSPAVVARLRGEDDKEYRALLTGLADDAGALTWLDRLFADGEGAYMRATYPSVGAGRHTYPVVNNATIASVAARGATQAAAGSISTVDADPERVQHSYEIASVDELRMPGIGAYLASDLRMSRCPV